MKKLLEKKYVHNENIHNLKAPRLIVPHLINLFNPKSVIDVGCGIGTFLYVFQENGIENVLGVDGGWVDSSKLHISERFFLERDLEKKLNLNKRFDLALSLEVAEHLKQNVADVFVESLVSLSNIIIFAAAIPKQGGQNHINEQYPKYWQEKFLKHNFHFYDIFRECYWQNKNVPWWYKQNMFLIGHESVSFPDRIKEKKLNGPARMYIHPELYEFHMNRLEALEKYINKIQNGQGLIKLAFRIVKNKFSFLL